MGSDQVPATSGGAVAVNETRIAIHVGLDLAASVDYTALTVAEVLERVRPDAPLPPAPYHVDDLERETFYRVQALQRLPHGLTWPQIGAYLVALLSGLWEEEMRRQVGLFASERRILPRALYADATGLGGPLVAILKQALADEPRTRDVDVWGLTFVHGEKFDRARGVIGKTRLISNLQALLATDRVELPKHDPMTPTLLDEIRAYHISIDRDGKETLGGMGAHDDMVTSWALACLDDPMSYQARSIPFSAAGWQ